MNNRMRKELDHMMQNLTFDPAMMDRARRRTRRRGLTYPAKRAIAIAVAAVLLTTGALAAGITLLDRLRSQLGPFGGQVAPVVTSSQAEEQGFIVKALASMADSHSTKVYLSVQDTVGGRLDGSSVLHFSFTDLSATKDESADTILSSSFGAQILSYDPSEQTAVFELSMENGPWANLSAPDTPREISITVDRIQSGLHSLDTPISIPVSRLGTQVVSMQGGPEGRQPEIMKDHPYQTLPRPEQTPYALEGLDGVRLSSFGMDAQGILHVLFELPEALRAAQDSFSLSGTIVDPDAPDTPLYEPQSFHGRRFPSVDGRYVDFYATGYPPVSNWPEDAVLQIYGSYATLPLIQGEWTVQTTIEPAPERTLSQPTQVWVASITDARLSPLGLSVKGTMEKSSSLSNLVITMEDGTVYSYPGTSAGIHGGPPSYSFVDYWDFSDPAREGGVPLAGPLDIDKVAKVTVSGVELPFDK